ncbi:MAG: response regulator transcription factor [Actinobacteria bacterium]|nr:response regulator transcription factor [Actinomycetota bacterium]
MSIDSRVKPVRIVVAEDHEEARKTLVRLIGLQGEMEVVGEASNGIEAISKAKSLDPDVLLIDIRMPEMDGIEAITVLRAISLDLKIIVLSAHEDEAYVADAIKHGADAYILKGLSMEMIVEAIREVIKGKIILSPDITAPLVKKYRQADAVLSGFYKSLYQSDSIPQAIEKFLSEILYFLEGDSCCIFRGSRLGMELHYELYSSSRSVNRPGDVWDDYVFNWLSSNADTLMKDAHGDEPLVLNEFEYNRFPGSEAKEKVSLLIMPISTWSRCSGWMICCRKHPFSSYALDMRYLYAMVGQLGLILDNVTLYEDLEKLELKSNTADEIIGDLIQDYICENRTTEALKSAGRALGITGMFAGKLDPVTLEYTPVSGWNVDNESAREYLTGGSGSKVLEIVASGECFSGLIDGTEVARLPIGSNSRISILIVPLFDVLEGEYLLVDIRSDGTGTVLKKSRRAFDMASVSLESGSSGEEEGSAETERSSKVTGLIGLLLPEGLTFLYHRQYLISRLASSLALLVQG